MKTIDEVRRENLAALIKRDFSNPIGLGGQTALARHLGREPSQIGQWVRGAPHPSTGKPKGMSDDTVRMIEDKCGLQRGWLDTDHSNGDGSDVPSRQGNSASASHDVALQVIESASSALGVQIPQEKQALLEMLASAMYDMGGEEQLTALAPMLLQLAAPPPDAPRDADERMVLTGFRDGTEPARRLFLLQARHSHTRNGGQSPSSVVHSKLP